MISMLGSLKAWVQNQRTLLFTVAAIFFVGGMIWSAATLGLSMGQVGWKLIAAALLLNAISSVFNASELQLCASACGGRLSLGKAISYSSLATVANILPLPGSIIVRGSALREAGASWQRAGAIIAAAGLLWLFLAVAISGPSLLPGQQGIFVSVAAMAASLAIAGWIAHSSSIAVAAGFVAVRAIMLALLVGRLWLVFAALGATITLHQVSIYTVVGILGNTVTIFPAGLGLTEAIGAAMAEMVGHDPAIAFLALSLHRLMGLALAGAIVLGIHRPVAAMRGLKGY